MNDTLLFKGFANDDTFIRRGVYQETTLDKAKKNADMLLQAIDGNWYTLWLNKPIRVKTSRRIKTAVGNDKIIYVTESVYKKLSQQYNIMCDF